MFPWLPSPTLINILTLKFIRTTFVIPTVPPQNPGRLCHYNNHCTALYLRYFAPSEIELHEVKANVFPITSCLTSTSFQHNFWDASMLVHVSIVHSLLLLSSTIPLNKCARICLSNSSVEGHSCFLFFCWLHFEGNVNFHVGVFVDICFYFSWLNI